MGKTLCRSVAGRRIRWASCAIGLLLPLAGALRAQGADKGVARDGVRLDSGRVTVVAERRDERLAHALLVEAVTHDTFPGLPRPRSHILIAIAPDQATFRGWVGPSAPEWGAAIAMPEQQRIVMRGSSAGSDAGNPISVLRHELAHLALHEFLGDLPKRWFDEGYASLAAGEWSRSAAFETSVGMSWRALPDVDALEAGFAGGATRAEWTYALSHLAVSELARIDTSGGLTNFFAAWQRTGSYDRALREAFGLTGDGYNTYWHSQVRHRYGAFAFVADFSLVFGFFGLMLGPLFWARKRRDRRRLEAMRAADIVQEAALRASMLAELAAMGGSSERDHRLPEFAAQSTGSNPDGRLTEADRQAGGAEPDNRTNVASLDSVSGHP